MAIQESVYFDLTILGLDKDCLPSQECNIWHSHKHFWQPIMVHKLLNCPSLYHEKYFNNLMMFEEDIIFATAVADDLEFTSDDIFFGDELFVSFSTLFSPS